MAFSSRYLTQILEFSAPADLPLSTSAATSNGSLGVFIPVTDFPSTSLVDDFNYTENPISNGGTWSTPLDSDESNATANGSQWSTGFAGAGSYLTGLNIADAEAWLTINAVFVGEVNARVSDGGTSTPSYYRLQFSAGSLSLGKVVSGTATDLATVIISLPAGTKVGIRTLGTTITAYIQRSVDPTWMKVMEVTDSDLTSGSIGINGGIFSADDFGGGEPVVPANLGPLSTSSTSSATLALSAPTQLPLSSSDAVSTTALTDLYAPTTDFSNLPVIDNFNYTEDPISHGGVWDGPVFSGNPVGKTNGSYWVGSSGYLNAYRTDQSFVDGEAYMTVVTSVFNMLGIRMTNPGSPDGYTLFAAAGVFVLFRLDSGVSTQLANDTINFAAGDQIGIRVNQDKISTYLNHAGRGWQTVQSVTDSTHTGPGTTFISSFGAAEYDDFGGGSYEVDLGSLTSSGASTGSLAISAPTEIPLNASDAVSTTSLALSAQTVVSLSASDSTSSATLALNSPTQVSLNASDGNSAATLALSAPTQITLGASDGQSTTTLALSAQPLLSLSTAAASTSALSLSASTQIVLAQSDGASSSTLALSATTQIPLNASDGASSSTLALSAPALVSLSSSAGSSTASLSVTATTNIPLNASDGVSTATLSVSAQTVIPLASSDAQSASSLSLTAPTVIPLAGSSGQSAATLALSAPATLVLSSSAAQSASTLALEATTEIPLDSSDGQSAATITLYASSIPQFTLVSHAVSTASLGIKAQTEIPLDTSDGVSNATISITAPTLIPLNASAAQSSATIAINAPALLTLESPTAQSSATISITALALLQLSSAATSTSSLSVYVPTEIPLDSSDGTSTATLGLTAQPTLALSSATAQSTTSLSLSAKPTFTLSSSAISTGTLAITAPGTILLSTADATSSATAAISIIVPLYLDAVSGVSSAEELGLLHFVTIQLDGSDAQSLGTLNIFPVLARFVESGSILQSTKQVTYSLRDDSQSSLVLNTRVHNYELANEEGTPQTLVMETQSVDLNGSGSQTLIIEEESVKSQVRDKFLKRRTRPASQRLDVHEESIKARGLDDTDLLQIDHIEKLSLQDDELVFVPS